MAQLPFFACKRIILDAKMQKDISRYIYCTELGISPYPGDYSMQPQRWIDKFFIIKSTINDAIKKEAKNA